ncbi:hypothetical protein FLJC2902T_30170 [Flavobacterium limnosediminis JC2902]|uniref:Uncharacterized protein n=1 Tax=Flavobacterium limnosediminis JC2902 TaxID=1341181 RepID=V6SN40_9FLAO|nr:hypothetical protein FLJC2902T_30170 [Flavobacterium limnosediminis JC2902]
MICFIFIGLNDKIKELFRTSYKIQGKRMSLIKIVTIFEKATDFSA